MIRDEYDFAEYIASYPWRVWDHFEIEMSDKHDNQVPLHLQINRAVKEDCRKRLEIMNKE